MYETVLAKRMPDRAQMIERQRVLAKFGELALRSNDLQEVLTEACRLVAEALDADFAKVLELQAESQELFVRAGVGWQNGIVGQTRLPMHERSSETYASKLGEPVITTDIMTEERFVFPQFLIDHGVRAIVNVPIFTPGGGPAYGLLQVDKCEPHEFDEQDIAFLKTYSAVLGPVIDRLHKVVDLRSALAINQRLLAELQHRIKNNIGVITSLVWMRSRETTSVEARAELQAVAGRIETLRLVHEQLYAAGTVNRLPLRPYLTTLVESLDSLYNNSAGPIRLDIDIDEVELAPEVAAPLGLILNEFATNSLKYAFDSGGGMIAVYVKARANGRIHVRLSDDGKGLPESAARPRNGSGTGMKLIDGLARQIGGKARWTTSAGTALSFEIAGN